MTILEVVLSKNNKHERDDNIKFYENGHKYEIMTDLDTKYTSVTTWCHSNFPQFDADDIIYSMMKGKNWKEGHKYWGLDMNQIKELWEKNKDNVAGAGTNLHYEIECFYNNPSLKSGYTNKDLHEYYKSNLCDFLDKQSMEWKYFIKFIDENPNLKPYRTEWLIYNEDIKIAGSIDMIFENEDGTLSIYDWKRVKNITRINNYNKFALTQAICHLPDSNFWHYTLQLNTYKYIIEQKYNKIVRELFLVRLHPEAEELSYELIKLPILEREMKDLLKGRK